MTPFDCQSAHAWALLTMVNSSDIPGIMKAARTPRPMPAPQPVAPTPTSPAGLGSVRPLDHRLGDFSGATREGGL